MNKQTIVPLATVFLLAACGGGQNNDVSLWDEYQSLASKIEQDSATAPLTQLASDATKLTDLSIQLFPEFLTKQPICSEYINAAIKAKDEMLSLPLEDIEAFYHADGKLPAMQQAVCYHAKDLLVHPATVAVIGKTQADTPETRDSLKHEIEEVLEHFSQVKSDAGL